MEYNYPDTSRFPKCGKCGEPLLIWVEFPLPDKHYEIADRKCRCQRDESERLKAAEAEKRKYARRLECLPRRFCEFTFENDNGINPEFTEKLKDYCRNLSDNIENGRGVYIYGAPGEGKTYGAMMIANYAVDRCKTVRIIDIGDLYHEYRFKAGKNTLDFWNTAAEADITVIDDLGTEIGWGEKGMDNFLRDLIEQLSRRKKSIIVTTNYDLSHCAKDIDSLRQRAYTQILEICPLQIYLKSSVNQRYQSAVNNISEYRQSIE